MIFFIENRDTGPVFNNWVRQCVISKSVTPFLSVREVRGERTLHHSQYRAYRM